MTIQDFKSDIKSLVAKQIETKEQRKTVNFKGTNRSLTPWQAQMLALEQKNQLKHMYIAYALLRGKSIETVIKPDTDFSQRRVDEIMAKYADEVIRPSENGS